jgi:hypothetical protein
MWAEGRKAELREKNTNCFDLKEELKRKRVEKHWKSLEQA